MRRLTISDCIKAASARDGLCLSDTFVTTHDKLKWQCAKGHQWLAPFNRIRQGKWCPKCAGKQISIDDCHEVAQRKGGKCLSKEYINGRTKLKWQCAKGHEWNATPRHILASEVWCPVCRGKVSEQSHFDLKLKQMQDIATYRSGKLLSTSYKSATANLTWECSSKHQWKASPNNVIRGTWCPKCNQSHSEQKLRVAFETIFTGHTFQNVRPSFLKGHKGANLELDGYSDTLKLAFEFDGMQHFKITQFSKQISDLKSIKKRDRLKEKLCREEGITLLRFSYQDSFENIPALIRSRIPSDREELNNFNFDVEPDYRLAYSVVDPLIAYQSYAKSRGGRCLSTVYINSYTKLLFECSEGHQWKANPYNVKNKGQWCKKCSHKKRVANRKDFIPFKEVEKIRTAYKKGNKNYTKLGEEFGVSRVTISNIINFRTRQSF